jgi:hypothetical protein
LVQCLEESSFSFLIESLSGLHSQIVDLLPVVVVTPHPLDSNLSFYCSNIDLKKMAMLPN